ncbi:MAG: hypothetical protein EOO68_07790, partial [Moraxellaceae bacterium]
MFSSTSAPKRIRIGDLLVEKKMITETQLKHALQEQKLTGRKLGAQLVDLGYVDENELLNLLSAQLEIPFVQLKQFRFDKNLVQTLPETSARRYRVMVLREDFDGQRSETRAHRCLSSSVSTIGFSRRSKLRGPCGSPVLG